MDTILESANPGVNQFAHPLRYVLESKNLKGTALALHWRIALTILALSATSALAEPLTGIVVSISDGDTRHESVSSGRTISQPQYAVLKH